MSPTTNGTMTGLVAVLLAVFASLATAQVNRNPRFVAGPDINVVEDSGAYSNPWAPIVSICDGEIAVTTDCSAGADRNVQTLRFEVLALNPSLFSTQPAISTAGALSFVPAPNAFGTTQVTVVLIDDGNSNCQVAPVTVPAYRGPGCPCDPGDCRTSRVVTFSITITPVNDCPTFQVRGDQRVDEDSGQTTVTGFVNQISHGALNEAGQNLRWTIVADNPALFSTQPRIQWLNSNPTTADLIFAPAPNAFGQSRVTLVAIDDGGTDDGGCQVSTMVAFNIIVNPINDPPSFVPGVSPVTVAEDSGPASFPGWATVISPGPPSESAQTVRFNLQFLDPSHASLFTVAPAIDPVTGTLTFTPAVDANTFGRNVQMYVQAVDNGGQTPRDLSCNPITTCPIVTFVITPVNDPPRFIPGGHITVWEDLMDQDIPPVPPVYTDGNSWATGIVVGPQNEGPYIGSEGQLPVFVVGTTSPFIFDVQPQIDSRGSLTFQLKKDFNTYRGIPSNPTSQVAVVNVELWDTGVPPVRGTVATFHIEVLPVNDPPSFVISHFNPLVIRQDAPQQEITAYVTEVRRGPDFDEEDTQQARFVLEPMDITFFEVQPVIDLIGSGQGNLKFRVKPGRWGTTQVVMKLIDTGGVLRRGVDVVQKMLTIIVTNVNAAPHFELAETEIVVVENDFPQGYSRGGFARNISAGAGEEEPVTSVNTRQQVAFQLTTNMEHLFSIQPTIDAEGRLTFTPARDQYGIATVTVIARDDHIPPAFATPQSFVIRLQERNNPPTFTLGPDIVGRQVSECMTAGACARTFARFATDITTGPINERDRQSLTFTLTMHPQFQALFSSMPAIHPSTGTLTFTLALQAFTQPGNPVVVTVAATDNGGTMNGGVDTTVKSFRIEIAAVNNPPMFVPGVNVDVLEDAGLQRFLGWATGIRTSASDASTNGLVFTVIVADPALFSVQPFITIDPTGTGTLSFTSAPDRFGSTLAQITLDNQGTNMNSDQHTVTITITPVNDAPSFVPGRDITTYESSGDQLFTWATAMTPGPFEAQQTLQFTVTCNDNTLFAIPPAINEAGEMKFTLAASKFGMTPCLATLMDNGGRLRGGQDTVSQRFSITVNGLNDSPSFVKGNDVTILEGAPAFIAPAWATRISAGAGDANQQLTFDVKVDRPEVFDVPPRIDPATGALTFTTRRHANGNVYMTVFLQDDGPSNPPSSNRSPAVQVLLIITPVNSAPLFTRGSNVAVLQNHGLVRQARWATGIAAGPADDERMQTLRFEVTATEPSLFALPPAIDPLTGDLLFATAVDRFGSSSLRICLLDNGGTENGGVDRVCDSAAAIAITPVNGEPFAVIPPDVTVLEDAGPVTIRSFLTAVRVGPVGEEVHQQLVSITVGLSEVNKAKFAVLPRIALTSFDLTFTTAQDWFGEVPLTVTLVDSGDTANGGSNTKVLRTVLRVLSVNDPPMFVAGPAVVELLEGSPTYNQPWASAILSGPPNEAAQTTVFSVVAIRPSFFSIQPTMNTLGYLTFAVAPDTSGDGQISVVLKDNGGVENSGVDTSAPLLLTIRIIPVNDAPSFAAGPTITANEDAGPFVARQWATNIRAGPDDEALSQRSLAFEITVPDETFFTTRPTVAFPSGDLSFTVAPNRFGVTSMTVVLNDNGGTENGGVSKSAPVVASINILPVNDAPTFETTGDITVLEDAGDQIVRRWITAMTSGPYEAPQTLTFSVVPNEPSKFTTQPRIAGSDLIYRTAPDVNGVVILTVNATDLGGRDNGGVDTGSRTFQLNIVPVNDPPIFTVGTDVTVPEGTATTTFRGWLPLLSPGPLDEAPQLLTAHMTANRNDILAELPLIDPASRSLVVQLRPDVFGVVMLTLRFTDNGGTANGGVDASVEQSFRIVVTSVNSAPTFRSGSAILLVRNTVGVFSQPWASEISAGPGEVTQGVSFHVTCSMPSFFTAQGQPIVATDGTLSFTVAPLAAGNATLGITLRDTENGVSATSFVVVIISTATVDTIVVVMSGDYETFNVDAFRIIVAESLRVSKEQVVIRSVARGSVRVEFQIVTAPGSVLTSDPHTRAFVADVSNPSSPTRQRLGVLHVATMTGPAVDVGQRTPVAFAVPRREEDRTGEYVGIAFGVFGGVLLIVAAVVGGVWYRRRRLRGAGLKALDDEDNAKDPYYVPRAVPRSALPTSPSPAHTFPVDFFTAPPPAHPVNPIPPTFTATRSPSPFRGRGAPGARQGAHTVVVGPEGADAVRSPHGGGSPFRAGPAFLQRPTSPGASRWPQPTARR